MLMKNTSTEKFDVELLLLKDDLTFESYKEYKIRNGINDNSYFYANYKTGNICNEHDTNPHCYRINSNGKLILTSEDAKDNKKLLINQTNFTEVLLKLKAIEVNELADTKNRNYDLMQQSNTIIESYYRYKMYPHYLEPLTHFWKRVKQLIISCVNGNSKIISKDIRIQRIEYMDQLITDSKNKEFDWYNKLQLFKPLVNERKESYNMRMIKYGRMPLVPKYLRIFYSNTMAKYNAIDASDHHNKYYETFEQNILQNIFLCDTLNMDHSSGNMDQSSSSNQQTFEELFPSSMDHRSGSSQNAFEELFSKNLVQGSSSHQTFGEHFPSTLDSTPKLNQDFYYQYQPSTKDYMNQNILNQSQEYWKYQEVPDIMHDTVPNLDEIFNKGSNIGDMKPNLDQGSSYQNLPGSLPSYVDFMNKNNLDTSHEYLNYPEGDHIMHNIDSTTPDFDQGPSFPNQTSDLNNTLDDLSYEQFLDLDEILK